MGALVETGTQIFGNLFQGNSQANVYNAQAQIAANNAILAQRNADVTMGEGEQATSNQQLKNRATVSAIGAEQAASGIDVNSGSAVDTKQSAAELGQLDALTIRSDYARKAYGYRVESQNQEEQSAIYKSQAAAARTGSYLDAFSSLLSGTDKAATELVTFG